MTDDGMCRAGNATTVRRLRREAAAVLVVLVVVGACESPPSAPDPVLVWPAGEPQGSLESDEWVKAARAAELAYARASNTADFSHSSAATTWDSYLLERAAARLQGALVSGTTRVHLGPRPFTPLAVEVADDGKSAIVATCVDTYQLLPAEDDGNRWPNTELYLLELGSDGHRRIVGSVTDRDPFVLPDGAALTADYCDGVNIPRAVFDPAPDLAELEKKGRDDVVLPSPSSAPTP